MMKSSHLVAVIVERVLVVDCACSWARVLDGTVMDETRNRGSLLTPAPVANGHPHQIGSTCHASVSTRVIRKLIIEGNSTSTSGKNWNIEVNVQVCQID